MAYGKNTCIFPCFFLHFYPFLFIPVFRFLFLVIALDCSVSFPGSKNYSQKERFSVQSFAQKAFPFKFPIVNSKSWFSKSKWTVFRWTVVYTISLHSSTEQNNEAPFFFAGSHQFFVRKSGTLRWHMEKTPAFFLVFCISIHSSSFPFFVSYSLLFRLIALFPFPYPKTIAKRNTFKRNFSLPFQIPNLGSKSWIWVPSRDSPISKWTVLSGQLFIQFRFTPRLKKVMGSFFLCWISPIWLL